MLTQVCIRCRVSKLGSTIFASTLTPKGLFVIPWLSRCSMFFLISWELSYQIEPKETTDNGTWQEQSARTYGTQPLKASVISINAAVRSWSMEFLVLVFYLDIHLKYHSSHWEQRTTMVPLSSWVVRYAQHLRQHHWTNWVLPRFNLSIDFIFPLRKWRQTRYGMKSFVFSHAMPFLLFISCRNRTSIILARPRHRASWPPRMEVLALATDQTQIHRQSVSERALQTPPIVILSSLKFISMEEMIYYTKKFE